MSIRTYRKTETLLFPKDDGITRLPTGRPIAIYYRQSTLAQVGNISTTIQTVDMVEYLKGRGWQEKDIILIDMDEGVSGTTRIDERPGMTYLNELITEGRIGAVACQDEDRLFRDVTQIQVNIFIEACRQSRVLVLTPNMVYDFANKMTGSSHAQQFRFRSEMAAEFIKSVIHGRLVRAQNRLRQRGCWSGNLMPIGYMVDMRKTLPNGNPNDNWRKYTVFEPYAEVIREYFRLFIAYSGNSRKASRHIAKSGPYYPDPEKTVPPEGFKIKYRMKAFEGRYYPTRTGLASLCSNAAYIGHWVLRGAIVVWNNHPAIIDEETFMKAFNYLSSTSLDGHINPNYRRIQQNARPSKDEKRPTARPLCAGLMVTQEEGSWYPVGTNWRNCEQHYVYWYYTHSKERRQRDHEPVLLWRRKADGIDAAISRLLKQKLTATFNEKVWEKVIGSFDKNYRKHQKRQRKYLEELEARMANLTAGLDMLTNPQMVMAAQQRFEETQQQHAGIKNEIEGQELEAKKLEKLRKLRTTYGPALIGWDDLDNEEKRALLSTFVSRVEATPGEAHSLLLRVRWRDNSVDELPLRRQSPSDKTYWLPEEIEHLNTLIDAGADTLEIATAFPDRKWTMIRNKCRGIRLDYETLDLHPRPMRSRETYNEYVERVGIDMSERVSSVYWPIRTCRSKRRSDSRVERWK